jgi:Tol biopolymer transport system component
LFFSLIEIQTNEEVRDPMISPERYRKIDELFQAALEVSPAERAEFVSSACGGDEALRRDVESLLASVDDEWSLVDDPVPEIGALFRADLHPELAVGERLGHHTILSLLGAGGMGQVYLAEDSRLGRKVALKLLPREFTRDEFRLRRFQHEARAASALNHPNILTIHDIGEIEGKRFIATEFIDGETLRQRMKRGGLSVQEVLDVACQVAGALAAAHEAGIVHRDIKPENIMLRRDGYVKVLDFGLAKLAEEPSSGGDREPASCDTEATPGLLMGTVKYMSPEQAQGLNLDARSDVFSLGVVIYEMLAGRHPFEGEDNSNVITSILKQEPVPLSQMLPQLPPEIEEIVHRALAKDRARRYQSAEELLEALRPLRAAQSASGISSVSASARAGDSTAASITSITQQAVSLVTQHKLRAGAMLLTAVVVAGGLFYGLSMGWRAKNGFQDVKMSQIVETDKSQCASVSPDGKYIAHVLVDGSILLRLVGTNSNTVLVPPTNAVYYGTIFSRDGDYVYYVHSKDGESSSALYRVPVSGGESQKILSNVDSPIAFSPDGKSFAFVRNITSEETGLFIAGSDGSGEVLVGSRRSPDFFSSDGPSWSPDGKLIACALYDDNPDSSYMTVAGVSVEDGSEKLLTSVKWATVSQVAWVADNSGFIMAAKEKRESTFLWHVSYPGGESRRITNDPSNYPSGYSGISLTADSRTLVASRFEEHTNLWAAPPGDPGQISQVTFGGNHRYRRLGWTPDGRIVFPSDASGARDIWIMEEDGTNQKQLTVDARFNELPAATPDGGYIVFTTNRTGNRNIWRMNIDGSDPIQLTRGENDYGAQCSPDGRWVLYVSSGSGKATIWRIPIDGGEPIQLTDQWSMGPVASPDGSLVACWWYGPKPPPKIAVIPFSGGAPIKLLDALPGAAAGGPPLPMRWTSDGRSLIYCVKRNGVSNIWSQPLDGSQPRRLTDFKSEQIDGFDWSRDDRLLLSRGFTAREVVLIQDISR